MHGAMAMFTYEHRVATLATRLDRRFIPVLTIVVLSVLATSVAFLCRKHVAAGQPDFGWVSERWLAEYRADASRPSR
ncbi:MAG: hypothetical protein EXQ59_04755 [Acidobacteria bacterium]|nr:hypothetical protein [Acidobacteriota bacterium]